MSLIRYTVEDRIAYITINRPEKRNALNAELVRELKNAFDEAGKDDNVKVAVLSGEGDAFCAGADLQYLQQLQNNSYEDNLKDSTELKDLFYKIYSFPKIVIAKVNGHAVAGGCGLVTVCDFSFAVNTAHFGYTEVRIGFIPAIVMVFLVRKLGEARAKELLLSGNIYSARDAKYMGLVNWIAEEPELDQKVKEFAVSLIENNSSSSIALTKKMFDEIYDYNLSDALKYAAEMNAKSRGTEDCKKGISSFLKKEKPNW